MSQLQAQHTLPEVLATVESQDKAVAAKYSTNADTPQNKLAIKAEQAFHKSLADFLKAITKGYKGVPTGGLLLDYDVSPHSVNVNLRFSSSESRDVVDQGVKAKGSKRKSAKKTATTSEPKSRSQGASSSGVARSQTASSDSNNDKA